jgi:pimeloyl-ACP methyl ester carboxylesterase
MRDHPDGLRSVVLDSTYPPDVDGYLEGPPNLHRAFKLLFEACAVDPACAAGYPDLQQVLYDTVERLNREPLETTIMHPLTGHRYPARLGGDDLMNLIHQLLYWTNSLPQLPKLIYEVSQDNLDTLNRTWGQVLTQAPQSMGMYYSVQCNEEVPFSSWEQFRTILADYPELAGLSQSTWNPYPICAVWDSGRAPPGENEPVVSDIPALVMSGERDPVTPPAWGQHAAETLENGYSYVFPGVGHGASGEEGCPRDMMMAFILNPTSAPDYACVGGEPLEMVFFSNPELGIRGIAPGGWTETAPGVYERGRAASDATALVLGREPGTIQDLLARLAAERGFEASPDRVEQRESGHFAWDLYAAETQGSSLDLALAEAGGSAYYVLLVAEPQQRDWLCDKVFWPAVKRLNPAD